MAPEFIGTVSGIDVIADSGTFATSLTISGIPVSTATGGSGVDSVNSLTGEIIVIGKGEVGVTLEGQNIIVSGTDHILVESENGFFFQTVTGVVTLMESASYTRDIVDFTGRVFSGIASGTLSIDGTDVDGINNQTWTTSQSTDTATGNNSIPVGGRVLLTLSGESSFERFGWTYSTERT